MVMVKKLDYFIVYGFGEFYIIKIVYMDIEKIFYKIGCCFINFI